MFVSTWFYPSPKLRRGRLCEGSRTLQESDGDKRSRDFADRWESNSSTLIERRHVQLEKRIIAKRFPGARTKVTQPAASLGGCLKAHTR